MLSLFLVWQHGVVNDIIMYTPVSTVSVNPNPVRLVLLLFVEQVAISASSAFSAVCTDKASINLVLIGSPDNYCDCVSLTRNDSPTSGYRFWRDSTEAWYWFFTFKVKCSKSMWIFVCDVHHSKSIVLRSLNMYALSLVSVQWCNWAERHSNTFKLSELLLPLPVYSIQVMLQSAHPIGTSCFRTCNRSVYTSLCLFCAKRFIWRLYCIFVICCT